MSYKITFTDDAADEFRGLQRSVQRAVDRWIQRLSEDPYRANTRKLQGRPELRRVHVTDRYVMVYEPDDDKNTILITRIRIRDRAYRNL